jgi:hypothetical protein
MLCEHWHSSSSSAGDSAATLADLLAPAGHGPSSTDLSCSSPSSSSNGSPTCQQVWATISGPASGILPSGTSLKQQQQQHPSRASRVVVQALREAFLRTDAELAGTEVGEVVGTTAVTAVLAQEELFIGHTGELVDSKLLPFNSSCSSESSACVTTRQVCTLVIKSSWHSLPDSTHPLSMRTQAPADAFPMWWLCKHAHSTPLLTHILLTQLPMLLLTLLPSSFIPRPPGDSRAVLCRKGVAVPLTSDHKPGRADEMVS